MFGDGFAEGEEAGAEFGETGGSGVRGRGRFQGGEGVVGPGEAAAGGGEDHAAGHAVGVPGGEDAGELAADLHDTADEDIRRGIGGAAIPPLRAAAS